MANKFVKSNSEKSLSKIFSNIASGITSVFVFLLLVVFPLYTHDMYFDILGARYVLFKVLTAAWAFMLVAVGIIYMVADRKSGEYDKSAFNRFIDAIKIENLHKYINICDVFFVIMIIGMVISTIGARKAEAFDLLTEGFYGNAGRYQGLECWLIYLVLYICISRTYRFKKWHLDFALIACSFASVWAVTDFFAMNIFGFLTNVSELQKHQFASSVGNLNTLTNYTCMGFAIALVLFVQEKNIFKTIFYAICSILCLEGCVFGVSDNAAVGVGVIYIALPFFAIKNRRELVRYIYAIAILLFGISSGYWGTNMVTRGWWMGDSVLFHIGNFSVIRYMSFVVLILAVLVTVFVSKMKIVNDTNVMYKTSFDVPIFKKFNLIWSGIVILFFAIVVFIFVDVNITHIFSDQIVKALAPFKNFLIFNDDWGTHRGHNWRIAFTNFAKFNPFHKIFGYGPDTYLVLTERTFYEEMVQKYGEVYDSAHNEYVNYFICEGILGLTAYIGIVVSSVVYGAKKLKENKFIAACIVAVIAYAGQAVVNIAIPITTPIYFTLMFMCVAEYMVNKNIDEQSRL